LLPDGAPGIERKHVALVGMMGAGKSTVGKLLARRLRVPFVDTDRLVVAAQGRSVARIFADEGEAAFRLYECAAVSAALAGRPAVLATGGGGFAHQATRALIAERSVSVYLEAPAALLHSRLLRSRTRRPLMRGAPTLERVEELLAARDALYRQAHLVVSCAGRTREEVADEIVRLLDALADGRSDAIHR
jgi:shikimate kinase